ncbi:MAG: metallophosphoesterase [Bacteroidales bacterium]|nr:metallophosphoesterase [Bacteroidales bacterium]
MRSLIILVIIAVFIIGMDLYALRGIQHLFSPGSEPNRLFYYIYWGVSFLMLVSLILAGSMFQQQRDPSRFFPIMLIMGLFLMLYLPKLLFNIIQLLGDLSSLVSSLFRQPSASLRTWFLFPGLFVGLLTLIALGLGMARGRTHLKVFREDIRIQSLPESFHGLRIVQLSDIHLAGFYKHPAYIRRVVTLVNELMPDLVCFTGDMVHNFSEEVDPFTGVLKAIKAPLGKYAVLGNHDYGAYYAWNSEEEEAANLERVKAQIRASGFDLLLNEHRTIALKGYSLELIGVENWGKPPFPQRGDLRKAMAGVHPERVKILLSHDPSHWDLQVCRKEAIDLTLSGHTHGMQFGIEIGKFKWSPSRWTYRHWAGLYKENGQQLYVNRGLGYTGYPGRVGIRPEITLLTLQPG